MDNLSRGCCIGGFSGATGLVVYWLLSVNYSEAFAVFMAIVIAIEVAIIGEVLIEGKAQQKRRDWLRRHDDRTENRAIDKFVEWLSTEYAVLPIEDYNKLVRKSDKVEEKAVEAPVRKVTGVLAEDFSKAPEHIKREIFG